MLRREEPEALGAWLAERQRQGRQMGLIWFWVIFG